MIVEDFTVIPMGPFGDPAWRASPPGFAPTIVAIPTSVDRSLRVQATREGDPVTACRELASGRQRTMAEATLRVDRDDATGTFFSIVGDRFAVRLERDDRGRLAPRDGDTPVETDLALRPGAWYRFVLDIDPGSGTYALEAGALDDASTLIRRDGLGVGSPIGATAGLCFTAAGAPDASITVDEIRATTR